MQCLINISVEAFHLGVDFVDAELERAAIIVKHVGQMSPCGGSDVL